jgi:hypothetical protein
VACLLGESDSIQLFRDSIVSDWIFEATRRGSEGVPEYSPLGFFVVRPSPLLFVNSSPSKENRNL